MLDCSKDDIWNQSASQLLFSIGESIATALSDSGNYAEVSLSRNPKVTMSDARSKILSALNTATRTVIIFFDEVDYITPGSPTAPAIWAQEFNPFWRNLRVVTQESMRGEKKLSLFVGGVSDRKSVV